MSQQTITTNPPLYSNYPPFPYDDIRRQDIPEKGEGHKNQQLKLISYCLVLQTHHHQVKLVNYSFQQSVVCRIISHRMVSSTPQFLL